MKIPPAAAALLALTLLVPVAACNRHSAPAPDATGPVEADQDVQASPEDLIVEILRLREQGKADQAAQYFISNDVHKKERESLTEVDATILCSSQNAKCDTDYKLYKNGTRCSDTTSEEVKRNGVEVNKVGVVQVKGEQATKSSHDSTYSSVGCSFGMQQIGGSWWINGG